MNGKDSRKQYYKYYTLVFVVFFLATFLPFIVEGRSFVWKIDGEPQYLPYLTYTGKQIRDFAGRALHGDFRLRMFDFTIGMGSDLSTVFRSHTLDFLSGLVPVRHTEYLYNAIIAISLYLAGISFSVFCFYWKIRERNVLVGSMVYVFCGYTLLLGIEHPNYDLFLIILPLFLLTGEMALCRKNCLAFSLITALGFANGYYHMYMCTIALGIYLAVRFWGVYREQRGKEFLLMLPRMGAFYLLGVAMAAFVLFPMVATLLFSARVGAEANVGNLLHYSWQRYYQWFLYLIEPVRDLGANTQLSYAVIVIPALTVFFANRKKEHRVLKIFFLINMVFMLIPAGGFLMTGMSAVNNRWIFIFSLTVAFICALMLDELVDLQGRNRKAVAVVAVIYVVLAVYNMLRVRTLKAYVLGAEAVLQLICCTVVLLLIPKASKLRAHAWCIILAGVLISCSANGIVRYSRYIAHQAQSYMKSGTSVSEITNSEFALLPAADDAEFFRVDTTQARPEHENFSLLLDYQGISMYNSFLNAYPLLYMLDIETTGANAIHRIHGLKGHTAAEALANVRYFMTSANNAGSVPYGYECIKEEGKYLLFENQYPIPFGYTYDTWTSEADYEQLGAVEKEQLGLEAVVLSQKVEGLKQTSAPEQAPEHVQLTLPQEGENWKKTETGYQVTKANTSIEFSYQKRAGYECYVRFDGLYRNVSLQYANVSGNGVSDRIGMRGMGRTYSLDRDDYVVYLGVMEDNASDVISLKFTTACSFRLNGVEVIYVPTDTYASKAAKLGEHALQDVTFDVNTIHGKAVAADPEVMVFSIPYSRGWSVFVDGQKRELLQANVMYMGVYLEPGEHEIELRYRSPGSLPGQLISLAAWVCFLAGCIISRRKHKKQLQ